MTRILRYAETFATLAVVAALAVALAPLTGLTV